VVPHRNKYKLLIQSLWGIKDKRVVKGIYLWKITETHQRWYMYTYQTRGSIWLVHPKHSIHNPPSLTQAPPCWGRLVLPVSLSAPASVGLSLPTPEITLSLQTLPCKASFGGLLCEAGSKHLCCLVPSKESWQMTFLWALVKKSISSYKNDWNLCMLSFAK
jgi:hypothetical protein